MSPESFYGCMHAVKADSCFFLLASRSKGTGLHKRVIFDGGNVAGCLSTKRVA